MRLSWKENVLLVLSVASGIMLLLIGIILQLVLALIGLAVGVVTTVTVTHAVIVYAGTITYPGVALVTAFGAYLMSKAHKQKPRKFFDFLAQSGFWILIIITGVLVVMGVTWAGAQIGTGWLVGTGAVAFVLSLRSLFFSKK
jgi:hypothetical protein